jgi:hypothetical protein
MRNKKNEYEKNGSFFYSIGTAALVGSGTVAF